jgi:hypothetical protein
VVSQPRILSLAGVGCASPLVLKDDSDTQTDPPSNGFGSTLIKRLGGAPTTGLARLHLEDAVFTVLVEEWRVSAPTDKPAGLALLVAAYIKLLQSATDSKAGLEDAGKALFKSLSSEEFAEVLQLLREGIAAGPDGDPNPAVVVVVAHHALQNTPEGDISTA